MKLYEGHLNGLETGPRKLTSCGRNYKSITVGDKELRGMTASPVVGKVLERTGRRYCSIYTLGDEIIGLRVARATFYRRADAAGLLALWLSVPAIVACLFMPDPDAGMLYRLLLALPFALVVAWLLPWHLAVRKLSAHQNATGV